MQRFKRWVILFMIFVIMVSGCSGKTSVLVGDDVSKTNPLLVPASQSDTDSSIPEPDECLKCHSDKDLLISTAKPEEVVESESKGVG